MVDGTVEVAHFAFKSCKDVEKILLPESLRKIGNNAFYGCDSLKTVFLPDGIKHIGRAVGNSRYEFKYRYKGNDYSHSEFIGTLARINKLTNSIEMKNNHTAFKLFAFLTITILLFGCTDAYKVPNQSVFELLNARQIKRAFDNAGGFDEFYDNYAWMLAKCDDQIKVEFADVTWRDFYKYYINKGTIYLLPL